MKSTKHLPLSLLLPVRSEAAICSTGAGAYYVNMRLINLNTGGHAIIDNEDYSLVSQFKWYLLNKGRTKYVHNQYGQLLHRVVMKCVKGDGKVVDHKDHDGLNCQKENLRICTHKENQRNVRSHKDSTSKYLGVCWHKKKKKFEVRVRVEGKNIRLGYFFNETEAAKAYDVAAKKHYGEFANLNYK